MIKWYSRNSISSISPVIFKFGKKVKYPFESVFEANQFMKEFVKEGEDRDRLDRGTIIIFGERVGPGIHTSASLSEGADYYIDLSSIKDDIRILRNNQIDIIYE